MKDEDIQEIEESFELAKDNDIIGISIEQGDYVLINQELFDKMINEINSYRMKNKDKDGVELIFIDKEPHVESD